VANSKISALTAAASANSAQIHVVVSGGTNKRVTTQQMLVGLGVAQYVEGTCRATATIATLPPCNIFDMYVKVLARSSGGAGGTEIKVGFGAAIDSFATINVSGNGQIYRPDTNTASNYNDITLLQGASGAVVAAAPTASANANFVVGIGYFRT
jgi:hypothetical protein